MKRVLILAVASIVAIAAAVGVASADDPPGIGGPHSETTLQHPPTGDGTVSPNQDAACIHTSTYAKWSGKAITYSSQTSCTLPTTLRVNSHLMFWFISGWIEMTNTGDRWCYGTYCSASALESGLGSGRYYVWGSHYCANCIPDQVTTYSGVFSLP